jgi:putative hydrolase of the HAD superfamily
MNLVFDFAGVVFHWDPLAVLRRELPQQASDEARARDWMQRFFEGYGGDWGEFDRGTLDEHALVPRIAERTGLDTAAVRRVVNAVPRALQPHAPTVALLNELHAEGHRLFFLSNMPRPYADWLERQNPFLRLFEDGVISGRVGAIKPERAIFELASRRFGLAPQELLFFDDVPANVQAAREAGWRSELFTSADQARAALR